MGWPRGIKTVLYIRMGITGCFFRSTDRYRTAEYLSSNYARPTTLSFVHVVNLTSSSVPGSEARVPAVRLLERLSRQATGLTILLVLALRKYIYGLDR